ncbi:MAG: hypothetical protein AABW68_00745 [archaeon]
MPAEFTERQSAFDLSPNGENRILLRVVYRPKSRSLEKFTVILISEIDGKKCELFRADGSMREHAHVHYKFKNPPRKEYQNKEIAYQTVRDYIELIRTNWRWFLAQYKENYK